MAFMTQRICGVDIFQVAFGGEIIPKYWGMAQALDRGIQVACIAYIAQTNLHAIRTCRLPTQTLQRVAVAIQSLACVAT